MVKIPRRQTLLKVYRNILRKAASLSVVSMLLANTYLPYFALVPQIAHADAPPELSVSYDINSNDLQIEVNSSSKIDYLISYSHYKSGEVVLEGLQGNGDDSSGVYSKKFYLGTCSANDCIRHNVKRLIVQAYIKDLGWAREQRFVFEPNLDLSLVGKSTFEVKDDKFELEIKPEDETWLKDISTAVPSLTPTATQGPTATPIVSETVTPTPDVVVETPTVTPVIVETATPTNSPTPSPSPTATSTPTNTPTASPTATNTPTSTPSSTPTMTPTATNTPTVTPTVPVGRCGDGTVNQQSELCDDGNQTDGDYCNKNCQPNPNVCLQDVNMLSNGDFESPVVTSGSQWDIFNIFSPFIGWIPNWLSGVTSYGDDTRPDLANIELHNNVNGWASASGSQHTELDSDWMGPSDNTTGEPSSVSLSQNLMTIPGYKYEVKFSYSPRPGAAAGDNVMKFDFGSKSKTYGPVASGINWTSVTEEYVADSTPTTISFSDIGTANSEGMFLDNVSVTCLGQEATPTPSATATPTSTPTPAPYCGDGIVNGDEECDGGNGAKVAGASSNFCTSSCKLVPVYTGSNACSANTAPIKIGETIRVGSRDADGIALSLPSGKEYLFDVQGTYSYNINSSGNFADAAYGTNSNWSTTRSDIGIWGTNRGVTSLLGDLGSGLGVVLWDNDTTYNGGHQYQFAYTPTTNSQNFVISDWYSNWYGANCQNQGCMSDNDQGGLDLTIYECAPKPVKLIASKVVCDAEQYLPNNSQGTINAETAQNWVNNSQGKCQIASNWDFQYGPSGAGSFGSFQTDATSLGSPWKTFSSVSGVAEISIPFSEINGRVETREVFTNSSYIPFSNSSNVSAEFYCTGDTANYDNWEWLNNPQPGSTYYCVAFNALNTGTVVGQKYEDLDGDSIKDDNEPGLQGWEIKLYNETGNGLLSTTSTDAQGNYKFEGIQPNNYQACEINRTGWMVTDPAAGNVETACKELSVTANQTTTVNFGNFAKGDMEVMKYEDTDDVLGKSESEEYIGDPTFTFRVYKDVSSVWTKVGEESTDGTGKATFTDVFDTVGNYFVCEVKKDGWEDMRSLNNPANNQSGALDEYHTCDGITVSTSGYLRFAEFGNINKGKIKVYKFHDLDGDGKRDDGEPLLSGWNIFMDKEGADGVTEQVTDTNGGTEFTLTPGTYVLGETMQDDWYQSNIYCENDGEGVKITQPGYAYGHHGACSGWNTCGNAQTCALKACQANGYSNLVSYGDQKPCTQFNNCSLFHDINSSLDYQANWGNWCNVMGVTDIVCNNGASVSPTPSSSPSLTPSPMPTSPAVGLFNKLLGVNDVMAQPAPDSNTKTITVAPGERTSCYIGNYQKATVTVNKDVQTHRDTDVADDKKFEVSGGEALGTKEFSEVTPALFTLDPGSYSFNEVNIPEKYKLKSTIGDEDSETAGVQVVVTSGENASITFVNKKVKPNLTIRKFNDKWPNVQNTGSNILYSIVVKILDNDMQDVAMIDLPPEGFRYQSGTWKAYKNGSPYTVTEPVYSSPGTWYLGDLVEDDEVLLTYNAKIDNGTGPGIYKDMAWAYGCSETENCEIASEDMLLASSVDSTKTDPGIITDTVVGTKIEIPRTGTQSKAINIVEKREGQVLGASDVRLPSTGANDWVLLAGLSSVFAGLMLGLIYFGKKHMRKISAKFVTALLAFMAFALITNGAQAANLTVRINEPKSPTYDSFDLGFVALDIMNRSVTAKCYIKNTNNGGSYTQFDGDKLLKAGGDSEICKVTTGLLTSGSNKFKVEVLAGADSSVSQEVNVDFVPSSSGPWKPKSYGRNDKNDCDTEISFATADDGGRTVRVEAYRSTETEFTLNDGTKIASFDIGSGQNKTFTDSVPDCAKNYYYAIRAFDAANNASEHIGDSMITVVNSTTTSSSSSTTSGSGAIEVLGGSNIPGGGGTSGTSGGTSGQILGEGTGLGGIISGTPSVSPMVTGEVLGEDESTPTGSLTDTVNEISNSRGLWFIIGFLLVAAGAGVFAYYRWTGGGVKK